MNMIKYLPLLTISLFLYSCSFPGFTRNTELRDTVIKDAPKVLISSIVTSEQDNKIRVIVNADREFSYNFANHYEPACLIVDIPTAQFINLPQELTVGKGHIQSISLEQITKPYHTGRLSINLDKMSAYNMYKDNKSLIVDIDKQSFQHNNHIHNQQTIENRNNDIDNNKSHFDNDKRHFDYVIGGKDVLYITVYDEPDLSYDPNTNRSLRVSVDGKISFPFLGDVKVAGFSPFQLEKRLEKLLSEGYIISPHVSVIVAEYHSKEVCVLGAVQKPGVYPLLGRESILEIISKAGGVITSESLGMAGNDIIVMRKNVSAGKETTSASSGTNAPAIIRTDTSVDTEIEYIRLDLQKLLRKGDIALNINLQDQDTLYVPMAESMFVFGQVTRPGAIKLLEKEISVIEAISMAGGFTPIASPSRTRIVRVENGVEKTIYININKIVKGEKNKDIILKAGDIVVVPEAFF